MPKKGQKAKPKKSSAQGHHSHLKGFSSKAVHIGNEPDPGTGAVVRPICTSSTFILPYEERPNNELGHIYSRISHPNKVAFQETMAALEKGKHGIAFSSGLATANGIMNTLKTGDHIICSGELYGGMYQYFSEMATEHMGMTFTFLSFADEKKYKKSFTSKTKLVWMENPTNPLLKIYDIEKIAQIAHQHGANLVVDNTFMTPFFQVFFYAFSNSLFLCISTPPKMLLFLNLDSLI
jgi:cystathionine gamma-lyase